MTDEFVKLFTRNERRIFSYILSLIGDYEAADEVFQETSLVLWQKFAEYEPETHFGAWACRIAHFKVLSFRKQNHRLPIHFSERFVELVATAQLDRDEAFESRREALNSCLGKLSQRDLQLVRLRYSANRTAKAVADECGRPLNTVYKALQRIRRSLVDCVRRTLAARATI